MFGKIKAAALLAACLGVMPALANEIVWEHTLNLPVGERLPEGVKLDILGIAPGFTPDQAKSALIAYAPQAMADEGRAPTILESLGNSDASAPFSEGKMQFILPTSTPIRIEYTGRYELKRGFGENNRNVERIQVDFSAPSSGQQVLGVRRWIDYRIQTDQPRISEIIADLTARIGAPPLRITTVRQKYRWQFSGGTQVLDGAEKEYECYEYIGGWLQRGGRQEHQRGRVSTQ